MAAGCDLGVCGQNIHLIEIGWSHDLHTDLGPALSSISPQSEDELWTRKIMNKVLADVLFFVCAHGGAVIQSVADKIITRWKLFVAHRCGGDASAAPSVSIVAHSLGSVIIYDILAHQRKRRFGRPQPDSEDDNQSSVGSDSPTLMGDAAAGVTSRLRGFLTAAAEAGGAVVGRRYDAASTPAIPVIDAHSLRTWPQLPFPVECFFTVGSPLGLFLLARGHATVLPRNTPPLSLPLPTVRRVYNIVNPLDPVAFRLEPILNRPSEPCVALGSTDAGSRFGFSMISSAHASTVRRPVSDDVQLGKAIASDAAIMDAMFFHPDIDPLAAGARGAGGADIAHAVSQASDESRQSPKPTRRAVSLGNKPPRGGAAPQLTLPRQARMHHSVDLGKATCDSRGRHRTASAGALAGGQSPASGASSESARTTRTRVGRLVDAVGGSARRVDFEVPVSGWMAGIAALRSHTTYFDSPHVARFILMAVHPDAKAARAANAKPQPQVRRGYSCW